MKKKRVDPPKDFEVEDADAAFQKTEDAARRLFKYAPKKKPKRKPRGTPKR
jgi:hypothetical protein